MMMIIRSFGFLCSQTLPSPISELPGCNLAIRRDVLEHAFHFIIVSAVAPEDVVGIEEDSLEVSKVQAIIDFSSVDAVILVLSDDSSLVDDESTLNKKIITNSSEVIMQL